MDKPTNSPRKNAISDEMAAALLGQKKSRKKLPAWVARGYHTDDSGKVQITVIRPVAGTDVLHHKSAGKIVYHKPPQRSLLPNPGHRRGKALVKVKRDGTVERMVQPAAGPYFVNRSMRRALARAEKRAA